jgi:hypothetical protein
VRVRARQDGDDGAIALDVLSAPESEPAATREPARA